MIAPAGFEWLREGRTTLLVRGDVQTWIAPVLRALVEGTPPPHPTQTLPHGRGGTAVVTVDGHQIVVRPYRRGGLPARLFHNIYFGWSPRPFRELVTTETLRQRGAPVVEVYGAAVHRPRPGCYRGWLATRYLAGAQTLWEWAVAHDAARHAGVFQQVGCAIRRLHDCGGRHPDLNLNNILICPGPAVDTPAVVFVDFDRARLARAQPSMFAGDLERLRRSAQKLDAAQAHVRAADLATLSAAYRQGGTCA